MSIKRLDSQGIAALVGGAAARHLRFKNQGGENNFKGGRYEAFFGGHRIAKLSREYLEEGRDSQLEWQRLGFVDDYMARTDSEKRVRGYQLKNAKEVSWTSGEQPIEADFALQHRVCVQEGYEDVCLTLVCSSEELTGTLAVTVPEAVSTFSTVEYFPYNEPFTPLLFTHGWLEDDFAYLSNKREPTVIDAQQVADVVIGAWFAKGPVAMVSEVIEQARHVSPQLIRAMESDEKAKEQVRPELRQILDGLPDFSYDVARGFLHWTGAGDSTSGILPFDCFSPRFAGWQRHILKLQPKTFEDLEGTLQ